MKVKVLVTQSCLTLWDPMVCPWDSPGKNTGVDCHSLLQGNLPNPGIESGSPVSQADSPPSDLPGKPQAVLWRLNFNLRAVEDRGGKGLSPHSTV